MNNVQNAAPIPAPRATRDVQRARALAAARAILSTEGMPALNARRVAAAIGVSVGTLYNLFENFDEVILTLNLETLEELDRAFAALPRLSDPEAAIGTIAGAYLDFTAANRNRWASVLEFKTTAPHRFSEDFPAVIGRLVAWVERALAPLFPVGAEDQRRLSAAVLWTSLEGIGALTAADNLRMVTTTTAYDMAGALAAHYLAGVRTRYHIDGTGHS
jgi:AcrR family transcriptional regulator